MGRWLRISGSLAALVLCGSATAAGLGGRTNVTFSPSHGTQVEYLSRNGGAFLWYPGNATVVRGRWKLSPSPYGAGSDICFAYQVNSYNPAMGESGGHWECEPTRIYERNMVDSAGGDLFGLGTRDEVPFQLRPERTTLQALRQQG